MYIAVDPGKKACGVALFSTVSKELVIAKYVPNEYLPRVLAPFGALDTLFLERQYLTKDHPRPMDIVELSHWAGYVRGLVFPTPVTEFLPIRWKGNVPKPIMIKRILAKLSPEEVARIERTGYKDHNTIDAIGIGLYGLGRMQTGGT